MYKQFLSFLLPSLLLTSCFDPEDDQLPTTTEKQETVKKETPTPKPEVKKPIPKGSYHIAIAGEDFSSASDSKYLYEGVNRYAQNLITSNIGKDFTKLGSINLKTADQKWNFEGKDDSRPFEDYLEKIKSYSIDSLFVKVSGKKFNNVNISKLLKKEDTLKDVNIFMVGKENKSSLVQKFAGDNISTGIYNENIAAYIAGFQSAVGSIKFNTKNKEFLTTETSYFIGVKDNDADSLKKANAFRRGVIAASEHSSYRDVLSVNFVSKELDPGPDDSLSHSISNWKKDNLLYNIIEKSSFKDGEHQIIYIAGATAKDWRGTSADSNVDNVDVGDDTGLIGSLYNYDAITNDDTPYDDLKQWDFNKSIGLILDEHSSLADVDKTSIEGDNTNVNRHGLKVMGSIGKEGLGDWAYAQLAIKNHYLGFASSDFMGKHFIFGAPLNIYNNNVFDQSNYDFSFDSPYADETFRPSFWTVFKWKYDTNKLTSNEKKWFAA